MQALPTGGSMASLSADEAEVQAAMESQGVSSTLSIAGLTTDPNGGFGDGESVDKMVAHFESEERQVGVGGFPRVLPPPYGRHAR